MNRSVQNPCTIALVAVALTSAAAVAQEDGRYRPEDGAFSYAPPPGWVMRDFGGLKYQMAFGPPAQDFSPNIVVIRDAYPGSLDQYAVDGLATFLQMSPTGRVGESVEFLTALGARAIKTVATAEYPGSGTLHHVFYTFDDGASKFTVTCNRLAGDDEKLDALFDAAMRTFEVPAGGE